MRGKFVAFALLSLLVITTSQAHFTVEACGGFFCQNIPVDQQAERIIFAINGDNTITTYVQINYTGSAPDFSWVLPMPSVPEIDVAEIATFDELSRLTAPVFIPPEVPDCAIDVVMMESASNGIALSAPAGGSVEVLASGTAGPYAFDVITSDDSNAMITWLRTNNYRITEAMEPLIRVYNDEGMVFLAMKLQPDQGVQDIQSVVLHYEAEYPSIPLRLTAVAANPNMVVLTWVFADTQAVPTNYAHPSVRDIDIRFDYLTFNHNYESLLNQTVDLYDGRAFVTEYAQPTRLMPLPTDPLLAFLLGRYNYLTRLSGRISPEEMTVDPRFHLDNTEKDVNNVHDLTGFDPEVVWGCTDQPPILEFDKSVVPPGFE
jgi:hypothetical protein